MSSLFKTLLLSAVVTAASTGAFAQAPAGATPPAGHHHPAMHRMDPAKMQERMARHQAELKAKLNLSAGQEAAWNSYLAAMKPPADAKRFDRQERRRMHEEFAALSTPQRLERMEAMKAKRDAAMSKRKDATLNFYAALTPEQKKVFDTGTMHRRGPRGEGKGPSQS